MPSPLRPDMTAEVQVGHDQSLIPQARRRDVLRVAALLGAIGAISSLHYVTEPSRVVLHEVYNYLCYLPIILAAYWFGIAGGVVAAVVTSAAFIPHVRSAWTNNAAYTASQYAQIAVFHLIGLTVGVMAYAQQRLTIRYRDAAISLEQANRELHHSQAQLRHADRLTALGEIAAGLAHEIQNPLAAVKGALEIVAGRVPPQSPEAEFADIASKELARLEGLVGEFLTYARPHAPAPRPTDVHDIVAHVAALLRPEAERKGVDLVVESTVGMPTLLLDPEQITQVVFNVVLNAVQATHEGGQVRISGGADSSTGIIEVMDEGPGIPAEDVLRLFEPFFTTKPRGTGLGLAIAHRIVTAHRGTIEVRPRSPSGTVFRIRLPRPTHPGPAS